MYLLEKQNLNPVLYQYGNKDFVATFSNTPVHGIKVKDNWNSTKKKKFLFNKVSSQIDHVNDILIFATDSMIVKNNFTKVIGIQHGITSDIPRNFRTSNFFNLFYGFLKSTFSYRQLNQYKYAKYLIAVDYNFLNWYKTKVAYPQTKIKVIPNFTDIPKFTARSDTNQVRVIFARRLHEYRGTKLFGEVIEKVLKDNNIIVSIAGDGPDKNYLKEKLKKYDNVQFIEYSNEDSLEVHGKYDIAIIPTLGSEGTSLSLLEAMAAGCAVICTNVGGMTNIVIDEYNGLCINPLEKELEESLRRLIKDKKLRNRLSYNAYCSVQSSFNRETWEQKWMKIINELR